MIRYMCIWLTPGSLITSSMFLCWYIIIPNSIKLMQGFCWIKLDPCEFEGVFSAFIRLIMTGLWTDNSFILLECNRGLLIVEPDISMIQFLYDDSVQISFECTCLCLLGETIIQCTKDNPGDCPAICRGGVSVSVSGPKQNADCQGCG